jgi:hypothetical protein
MSILFVKSGRVFVVKEEDLDLVEEGWVSVARFKKPRVGAKR